MPYLVANIVAFKEEIFATLRSLKQKSANACSSDSAKKGMAKNQFENCSNQKTL